MPVAPTLATRRLLLRPFAPDDAPAVQALLQPWEVVRYTGSYPHPYPEGEAARWIGGLAAPVAAGTRVSLAVTKREGGTLAGAVELWVDAEHRRAELGFWLGLPFHGRGWATEAAHAMVRHAFDALGLHRVHARVLVDNAASAAVLRRVGMRHEGRLRAHAWRWDALHDLDVYGVLADDPPLPEAER